MTYFVYVLQSLKTSEFYKGLTNNLTRRLRQHFRGEAPSTKNKLPVKLIHAELCTTRCVVRKLEKFLKSGFGREIIEEIAKAEVAEWQTR